MARLRSEEYLKRTNQKHKIENLENKDKIREYAREYRSRPEVKERINRYQTELRKIAIDMGLCTVCKKREVRLGKKTCSFCAELMKMYNKNWRAKNKNVICKN